MFLWLSCVCEWCMCSCFIDACHCFHFCVYKLHNGPLERSAFILRNKWWSAGFKSEKHYNRNSPFWLSANCCLVGIPSGHLLKITLSAHTGTFMLHSTRMWTAGGSRVVPRELFPLTSEWICAVLQRRPLPSSHPIPALLLTFVDARLGCNILLHLLPASICRNTTWYLGKEKSYYSLLCAQWERL